MLRQATITEYSLLAALLLTPLTVAEPVLAQPATKTAPKAKPKPTPTGRQKQARLQDRDLKRLEQDLLSGDEARILAALDTIRDTPDAAQKTAPLLAGLLRRGSTERATIQTCAVAAELQQASLSEALVLYLRHRSPKVRAAAARALPRTGGDAAVAALRQALRSPDKQVRGLAATGLGELGANSAVDDLIKALDRRVDPASAALGKLCLQKQCEALLKRLGKLPFEVITAGLDPVMFRKEVSDATKIQIVQAVSALATSDAHAFLQSVKTRFSDKESAEVKKALDEALELMPTP